MSCLLGLRAGIVSEAVKVPADVLEGLEYVRESGETNMFDRRAVQKIASREGYYATLLWLEDHQKEYAEGIFSGFAVSEEA